ncbi:MAG: magnesium transporter [Chloracidobacterium sp.]|uniref:Magnesium transporter MgtE n=1 Tax=Chloracidobacterium validum TaxID=2821543 RepID=A0ABX8B7F9_9BACT|nr:magnesium transporter [Chloracidobacterium validum]QUW02614.1 magnesium transporter [Chloracidobacterium validum]
MTTKQPNPQTANNVNPAEALRTLCEKSHPAVAAEALSALDVAAAWDILRDVTPSIRTEIFSHLTPSLQVEMVGTLPRADMARLLSDMPPDDRADLFRRLPEESRDAVLPALAEAEREDIRRLTDYEDGTSGAVMTSEYATLPPDLTVTDAIERLREIAPDKETIYYSYVVDDERKLLGFVSLKDLILARRDATIRDIMHEDVIFARASDDQEDAARLIQKYDLIALPIVNEDGALVGIITHDDAIDIITQEHTEDMRRFMAIAGSAGTEGYLRTPFWKHVQQRVGWLVGLAALGLVSGLIIHEFEATLTQVIILALYMPMVADTGGNTGSQSATVVVRALALREIAPRDAWRVLLKEFQVSVFLAAVLGCLAWAKVVWLSQDTALPPGITLSNVALVIAAALTGQVVTATLIGALLPLAAARLKLDPAVVASPALTTIVDITGLLIYFFTARWLLGL